MNPLLQVFKQDKKVTSLTEEGDDGNGNKEEMENENQILEQNATSKKRANKPPPKKKKKKLLIETPPDFIEKEESIIQVPTKMPDFNYLKAKNDIEILNELKANPDWERKLVNWFKILRPKITNFTNGDDVSLKSVIASIQKGEMPKTNMACNVQDVDQILFFFERKTGLYEKSDLAWIFSALIFTDRLLNQDVAECLSSLLTRIIQQINGIKTKEDPLYPYLMTDAVLLQRFFHLSS